MFSPLQGVNNVMISGVSQVHCSRFTSCCALNDIYVCRCGWRRGLGQLHPHPWPLHLLSFGLHQRDFLLLEMLLMTSTDCLLLRLGLWVEWVHQ